MNKIRQSFVLPTQRISGVHKGEIMLDWNSAKVQSHWSIPCLWVIMDKNNVCLSLDGTQSTSIVNRDGALIGTWLNKQNAQQFLDKSRSILTFKDLKNGERFAFNDDKNTVHTKIFHPGMDVNRHFVLTSDGRVQWFTVSEEALNKLKVIRKE